jgi:3-oxoacyl-[acyl-carrier-protein] synthase I
MTRAAYIHEYAVLCPLGQTTATVRDTLLSRAPTQVSGCSTIIGGRSVPTGDLPDSLARSEAVDSRCNRIADHLLAELDPAIARHTDRVGAARVAVVVGTSTSGVREGEVALRRRLESGSWPDGFRYGAQELGDTAEHVAMRTGAQGPAFGISTACTSGAKALASAARLIEAGLCDVAVAGGIDSLCALTLNGFAALDALSDTVANPFSRNRRGINIGEGGALFILSSVPSAMRLAGWGESADAYHISSPDPEGRGAESAMRRALDKTSVGPGDIGYLNLHGTATKLNDIMEAKAVSRVFGPELPCSSTKPMTGHMLGAAGSCEAAFAIMALERQTLPAHLWDGERDDELPFVRLVDRHGEATQLRRAMSCSYAFGGNNIALAFEAA